MALKDKLMTLEDFKAVRDVDVASNSAQFTEIKADLATVHKNVINEITKELSSLATFVPFEYPVFAGKTYKFSNLSTAGAMLAYTRTSPDGSNVDNILGSGKVAGSVTEFTATTDADYVVVYANKSTTNAKFKIEQEDSIVSQTNDNTAKINVLDNAITQVIDPKDLTSQIGFGTNTSTGVFAGTDATTVVYSDYIEIGEGTTIKNHNETRYINDILTISRVWFYDTAKQFISTIVLMPLETATIPSNAKYVRFSYTYLQTAMTQDVANSFGTKVTNKILNIKTYVEDVLKYDVPTVFYVGANRTGENAFTTLRACTEYIWNNGIYDATVYVDKGTYNLETEYGSEWLEAWEKPASNPTASGLKVGNRTHYIFEHGAKILFNYSGSNTDIATAFSPINIAGSCVFDNMQIEAQNCRYCVHEDYYTINTDYKPYRVEYNNCEMLYHAKTLEGGTNGEPIGAGCMPGSVSIINGGCFINEVNQADISYHNFSTASFGSGTSMVVIKNAYMAHWCGFGAFGDSVVYGYVSGCRMKMDAQNGYTNNIIRSWGNAIESS